MAANNGFSLSIQASTYFQKTFSLIFSKVHILTILHQSSFEL